MTLASFALFLFALSSAPEVKVTPVGPDRYELELTVENTSDPEVAQRLLLPTAARLCSGSKPRFGRHRFESHESMSGTAASTITFVQAIACVEAGSTNVGPRTVPSAPSLPPNMKDESDVRGRTLEYLAAKDSGQFDAARAMAAPEARVFLSDDGWRARREAFNRQVRGEPRRQVLRITWYDDPQGAPMPGRYAAADYRADYADGALYCGYAMWLRQSDGSYLLMREEEGSLEAAAMTKLDPAKRQEMERAVGCRG